jgi:hypothetical protein
MKISIIFDPTFQGQTTSAVWIIESDENRRWFERQTHLDEGSAIFTPEGAEVGRAAILRSVWNVQEHYPNWSQIDVIGVVFAGELSSDLRNEGRIIETDMGFSLVRT